MGKELLLRQGEAEPGKGGAFRLGKTYLGSSEAVYIALLQDNLYALLFLLLSLLSAGMLMALAFRLGKKWKGGAQWGLLYLAFFVLDAGLWVALDSDLLLFVTGQTERVLLLSFVTFLVMPVFLLKFMLQLFDEMPQLRFLCRLSLLLTGLYLLNAIFRLLPDIFVLLPCHILMVCDLLTLLQGGLKHLGSKQVKSVIVGILLLTAFAVGALLRFYRNPLANYAYLYCIGIVLFAICLVNAAFLRLFEQLEENANTAAYKRLAYTDILTGLENRAAYTEALQTQGEQRALSCVVLDLNHLK